MCKKDILFSLGVCLLHRISEISRFSMKKAAYLRSFGDNPTFRVISEIFHHMKFGDNPTFRVISEIFQHMNFGYKPTYELRRY